MAKLLGFTILLKYMSYYLVPIAQDLMESGPLPEITPQLRTSIHLHYIAFPFLLISSVKRQMF